MSRLLLVPTIVVCCTLAFPLSGCQLAAQVGTAQSEANQKPPVSTYLSKLPPSRVFTAAVKAMGDFGTVRTSDRESGIVQGQKGNWIMNAEIAGEGNGTKITLSARYVPGKQMDFNSREALTADFLAKLQSHLNENLKQI